MSIHDFRTSHGTVVNLAIATAQNLERRETQRTHNQLGARRLLASKLKVGVGTLENLVRGRIKRIDAEIRDRLQALLIRELEQEIGRLQHELEIARQCGSPLNSDQMGEIETHITAARALLTGQFEGSNNANSDQGRMRNST